MMMGVSTDVRRRKGGGIVKVLSSVLCPLSLSLHASLVPFLPLTHSHRIASHLCADFHKIKRSTAGTTNRKGAKGRKAPRGEGEELLVPQQEMTSWLTSVRCFRVHAWPSFSRAIPCPQHPKHHPAATRLQGRVQ